MGNPLSKSNCCSNQFGHNKKEVDISEQDEASTKREQREQDSIEKKGNETTREGGMSGLLGKVQAPAIIVPEQNEKNQERIKYLAQIVSRAPILTLKVINSTMLPKGTEIRINAQGIEGSLRNKKDGFTFFGCKKKGKAPTETQDTQEILNDYIIRSKDSETNDRHRGRHFQIEYCVQSNTYKIRDLGVGFGAFIKIEHPLILRDNNLLSMGGSFLIINLDEDGKESLMYSNSMDLHEKIKDAGLSKQSPFNSPLMTERGKMTQRERTSYSEITVKIFGGPNYGEVYNFNSTMHEIKIGRMPDCEVKIEDTLLSKYQGTIKHVQDSGWILYDGYSNKPSTNSNWLYLNDDFEMYDGMIFKANHTLFQVFIENSYCEGNRRGASYLEAKTVFIRSCNCTVIFLIPLLSFGMGRSLI